MNTSWDDVRLFLAAAESKSLSEAARSLGVGQATVSRRIAPGGKAPHKSEAAVRERRAEPGRMCGLGEPSVRSDAQAFFFDTAAKAAQDLG